MRSEQLEDSLSILRNDNRNLQTNLTSLTQRLSDAEIKLENKEKEINLLKLNAAAHSQQQLATENTFIETLKLDITERNKEVSDLQQKVFDLRLKLSSQESEQKLVMASFESKIQKEKLLADDLQSEIQLMSQQFGEVMHEKDERIQQLERQLASFNRNSESLYASQQKLIDDRNELERRVQDLENQVNLVSSEKTAEKRVFEAEIDRLKSNASKFERRNAEMSTESRFVNEQSAMTIRYKFTLIKFTFSSLESRVMERESEIMSLRNQLQVVQSRDQNSSQFNKTREDVKHLREELQEMYDSYRREQQQALELAKEVLPSHFPSNC